MMIRKFLLYLLAMIGASSLQAANNELKPRLVVCTDIAPAEIEPDDMESMVRLMAYADQFEIEALITSVGWNCDPYPVEWAQYLQRVIEAYRQDVPKLMKRSGQKKFLSLEKENKQQFIGYWPSADYVKSRSVMGSIHGGIKAIGADNDSPGSDLLIRLADEDDPRPIYVAAWGGANTLAQAIWRVKQTRSAEALKQFVRKFRIYAITDQDMQYSMRMNRSYSSHMWLRQEFADDLHFVWDEGTWQEQCELGKRHWQQHQDYIQGRGALGAEYPTYKWGVEGDTPSFLYVMPNGLNNPDDPHQAGWAGYHERGLCADSLTTAWTSWQEPLRSTSVGYKQRFYPDELNDFKARMQWAAEGRGNHNPQVIINGHKGIDAIHITAKSGDTIHLDASQSMDVDGDNLQFSWWQQPEIGKTKVAISQPAQKIASIQIPDNATGATIHIICEVHDDGPYHLVAYRRIIISITQPDISALHRHDARTLCTKQERNQRLRGHCRLSSLPCPIFGGELSNSAASNAKNTFTAVTKMLPENGSVDVNIDTHLTLVMAEEAKTGNHGFVSVYDKRTGKLVDRLDMSIPAGPTEGQTKNPAAQYTPVPYVYKSQHITNRNTKAGTPSGVNAWDGSRYQLDIIGGFSDGFHFYPIIAHGRTLTIYLHHNMLDYDHEYYVTIDKGVIEGFEGIKGKKGWTFKTKAKAPDASRRVITVSADGKGDFSTVQGAMDFIPDSVASEQERYTVKVRNGEYEELVYFRNKRFVTIEGESREGVLVHYPNNEVFNPHPADIKTNEVRGTFPSRRAAFAADNCSDLIFRNLTVKTDCKGQAEGLLVNGERNFFDNIHIIGDGDALQANGSCYWQNCRIDGGGDTVLGRGPSFFNHCTLTSYGAFMWIRNTEENHGNVFVDCHFKGLSEYAEIGRLPDNKGKNYPYAECVLLNCTLENIPAAGWGRIDETAKTATILEFNSHDIEGKPIDISKRHPLMRQLHPIHDAELIGKYSDSQWVLGWKLIYFMSKPTRRPS